MMWFGGEDGCESKCLAESLRRKGHAGMLYRLSTIRQMYSDDVESGRSEGRGVYERVCVRGEDAMLERKTTSLEQKRD